MKVTAHVEWRKLGEPIQGLEEVILNALQRSRIHSRAYLCTGRSDGRQIEGPIQRPGAFSARTNSSHEQPQKHAACRPGKNIILETIITLRAPSRGHVTRHLNQAASSKHQATSFKPQATSPEIFRR
jgi:hypothetical protein